MTAVEKDKFVFKGSHPDSLYRVADDNGAGAGNMSRVLRVLRWPVALLALCVALAVFVYFLMPDHLESSADTLKATVFEPASPEPPSQRDNRTAATTGPAQHPEEKDNTSDRGAKTSEIDFYDSENDKTDDLISVINPQRKLPIPPVFPTRITPEVQYGNERADSEIIRTPKVLDKSVILQENSTLKPQITQSAEKPLKLYFEDADEVTSSTTSNPITSSTTISPTTETITRAETVNDYINYDMKQTTKRVEESPVKTHTSIYKEYAAPVFIHHLPPSLEETEVNIEQIDIKPELPPEIQEYYSRHPADPIFTSGHSKLFGISIEDAKTMKSTTQSSLYNTRVSPTLPTWRDGDDTTTRKYPINIYTEVPQCDSTRLALCRGVLPYDLAGSAALVGGVELTSLMPQIEYLVATNCSDRVRHFLCALLEPECSPPPYPPKMPCYNLCKAIVDNCDGLIARELAAVFNCQNYAKSGCISAKAPCYQREFTCGDGSCVPRDWICDGTKDCPSAEDEASCIKCDINEFRCRSGGCILKRWRCDGYNDCPDGEDEDEDLCGPRDEHVPGDGHGEIGEESAGSAPAPAVRRPNRVQGGPHRYADTGRTGENDSSRELLVTSDSSNAFKRNFTRRPSLSRLSSYVRPAPQVPVEKINKDEPKKSKKPEPNKLVDRKETTTVTSILEHESVEDVNMGDLGFFDEFDKQGKEPNTAAEKGPWLGVAPPPGLMRAPPTLNGQPAAPPAPTAQVSAPPTPAPHRPPTRFGNNMRKYETVIDGASLLKKAAKQMAAEEKEAENETGERNATSIDNEEFSGSMSAHASPCPSGELRCVDGRCITLAQLCDGTIDCTDHADEDNCYT